MPAIVTLGECLIDFVATEAGLPLKAVASFVRAAGGAPANVAVGVVRQGVPSGFIGAFSRDAFGAYLHDLLQCEGVDCAQGQIVDAPTALAFVSLDADGEREFLFYRDHAADLMLDGAVLDGAYIAGARVLHIGSLSLTGAASRDATKRAIAIARAVGVTISYDPNLRPDLWPDRATMCAAALAVFEAATIVKINEDELHALSGTTDIEEGIARLVAMGPPIVIVTLGSAGCRYRWYGHAGALPGYPVTPIDTTGAGDGFVAGLLASLASRPTGHEGDLAEMTGEEVADCLAWANATAALTTTVRGAIPALPTRAAVGALIAENAPGSHTRATATATPR